RASPLRSMTDAGTDLPAGAISKRRYSPESIANIERPTGPTSVHRADQRRPQTPERMAQAQNSGSASSALVGADHRTSISSIQEDDLPFKLPELMLAPIRN